MKFVELPGGEKVPALGLGTWKMGVGEPDEAGQLQALRSGFDLGLTLLDTAEMYGDGRSEALVGQAMAGRRDEVFLVSKVLPGNAARAGVLAACERSLKHLATDRIDLYLLHWRGNVPLGETVEAFEQLKRDGKIRHWGVSNFDPSDMEDLRGVTGDKACAANQVMYNLAERGIEWDLLPDCRTRRIAVMAYCPLGEGQLVGHAGLAEIAGELGVSGPTLALAWLLHRPGVIAIPKSRSAARVHENAAALDLRLGPDILAALDRLFPPPTGPSPLAMT
nr:aldo/keto reductase [uncultured Gellertiella sp.]